MRGPPREGLVAFEDALRRSYTIVVRDRSPEHNFHLSGRVVNNATSHDLFATPHDEANRAAVASVSAAELDFAGIALHADRQTVDKVLVKLRPHP